MGQGLEFWGAIAGILGLVIAILAFLRDLFNFQLKWATSGNFLKRLIVNRWVQIVVAIILFGFAFWSLYSRIWGLESIIVNQEATIISAYATQTAQAAEFVFATQNSKPPTETPNLAVTVQAAIATTQTVLAVVADTQNPQPTYTPYPTYTPWPTYTLPPVPPTSIPATPVVIIPTPTPAPISEKPVTPTSSSTPSQVTATPTPTISEALEPIQRYTLPLTGPSDIVYDGANLWAVFAKKLVKLESVEDGNRFRAIEQIEIPAIRSLDWDVTRNQYWAISARCDSLYDQDCIEEILLLNSEGIVIDTMTILQPLDSRPNQLVWDGEYLWVASLNGILYKLQANLETKELILDDSFGLSLQWGWDHLVGLAWDETSLWLLDGYILTKLDSSYQPVCRITLPTTIYISWWKYSGISWGERYLWVVHAGTNTVYRVDPTICE